MITLFTDTPSHERWNQIHYSIYTIFNEIHDFWNNPSNFIIALRNHKTFNYCGIINVRAGRVFVVFVGNLFIPTNVYASLIFIKSIPHLQQTNLSSKNLKNFGFPRTLTPTNKSNSTVFLLKNQNIKIPFQQSRQFKIKCLVNGRDDAGLVTMSVFWWVYASYFLFLNKGAKILINISLQNSTHPRKV